MSTKRASLRAKLSLTTALVGGAIGIGAGVPAAAQLPTGGVPNISPLSPPGAPDAGGITIAPGADNANRLDIDLNGNARSIITWNTFDVGPTNSVNFIYANPAAGAVLNRVTGGASAINGPIGVNTQAGQSGGALSVYLINPQGITFGTGANVNVGALIASTLDQDALADATFLGGGDLGRLSGTTGAIQLTGDAQLRGTDGEVVLIGAAVSTEAGTQVNAATDAAFVVASDVTINRSGSPLAFTIGSGTAVNAQLVSAGSVQGRTVTLAVASRAGITDALLVQGDLTATTAVATERGVVLAAGVEAPGVAHAALADTTGAASLNQSAGTITSSGTVIAAARDAAALTGTVDADGADYAVRGATVTLGGVQASAGSVSITAASAITGNADLRLTANKNGVAGGGDLTLATTDAGAGIVLNVDSALAAGTLANRSAIVVAQADAASTLLLGDLFGASFVTTTGTDPAVNGANRTGALRVGDVDLLGDFALISTSGNVTTGSVAANRVDLQAAAGSVLTGGQTLSGTAGVNVLALNGVTLGALTSTGGGVSVRSTAGNAAVTGAVLAGAGDYAVEGTSVTLGTAGTATSQRATGAVTLTGRGAGTITGLNGLTLTVNGNGDTAAAAEALTFVPGTGGIAFANTVVNAGDVAAAGGARQSDVLVGTAGPLTLGTVNARQLRTSTATAAITRTGTITAGPLNLVNMLDLGATALSLGQITVDGAGQALTLATTTGALGATGPLSVAGALSATSSGGGAITLGDITRSGSVLVQSSGAVVTGAIASSGTVQVRGDTVSTGALGTDPARIGGDVDVETFGSDLTAPDIFATGRVTLTASGDAVVPGTIAAGGGYFVTGNAVRLGVDGDAEAQVAGGAVAITARIGAITGGAGLTLQSGGTGNDITLTTQGAGAGFAFDATSTVEAGTDASRSNLILATADDSGPVTFGTVRAGVLQSQVGADPLGLGVTRTGPISFGSVELVAPLVLTSNGAGNDVTVTTATVTGAGNGITLSANGGTVVTDSLTANGSIALFGATGLNVGALTSIAANVSATSDAATVVATASARAGSVLIRGATGATLTTGAGIDIAIDGGTGTATGGTLAARDDIAVRGATVTGTTWTTGATVAGLGAIDADGSADTLAGVTQGGNAVDVVGGTLLLGTVNTGAATAALAGDLRLTANGGRLALVGGAVGGNAALTKTGATDELAVTGTLSVGTAAAVDPAALGAAVLRSDTGMALNTVTASGDLDALAATGIALTDGSGRDILLRTGGAGLTTIAATTLTARDDIVVRAADASAVVQGTSWTSGAAVAGLGATDAAGVADAAVAGSLAGRDIDVAGVASIAVPATRAIGAGSDIRLAGLLALPNADTDFSADADGDVVLGAVNGRDVFVRGGNAVQTGNIAARDDVVVAAGAGGLVVGNVTSGATVLGQGAIDTEGGLGPFAGNDIQLTSAGIVRFGALTTGDDIRVVATGAGIPIGDAASDLVLTAPGAISLSGAAVGRDIALSAATIAAGDLSARDDIVLRATATIATGALVSGATIAGLGPVETGAGGAADLLNGAGLVLGHDILGRADRVVVASVTTNEADGDVALTALADRLQLGDAQVVGNLSLLKQGSADELVVTGTVRAGVGSTADATIDIASTTNVRLTAADALASGVPGLVRDVRIAATGAATGLAIAPDAADGRPAPGFARMTLNAGRDVSVTAGGLAQVAAIAAGRDATVAAGTDVAEIAGTVVAGRDYRVEGSAVRLGTTAPGAVRQQANGLVRVRATGGAIDGVGDLTLVATLNVDPPSDFT